MTYAIHCFVSAIWWKRGKTQVPPAMGHTTPIPVEVIHNPATGFLGKESMVWRFPQSFLPKYANKGSELHFCHWISCSFLLDRNAFELLSGLSLYQGFLFYFYLVKLAEFCSPYCSCHSCIGCSFIIGLFFLFSNLELLGIFKSSPLVSKRRDRS